MRLPDPASLRADFQRQGFALVTEWLDPDERSAFFDEGCALMRSHSTVVDRADHGERLWYEVVTGVHIKAEGSLLFSLYTAPDMLTWVRAMTATSSLGPSPHLRSAININCMRAAGQRYPWHRDAVPYTAVLFLSSVPSVAGGALSIQAANDARVEVQPTSGTLIFMDGTRCPHAVSPLIEDTLRLTVPMVYPAAYLARPEGLDDYLYRLYRAEMPD
jgi:2OG-Fe(II) oxygenase superfamily